MQGGASVELPSRASGKDQAMSETWVGIDVSKEWLDVFVAPSAERMRVRNDETGFVPLTRRLKQAAPTLIVLEASGG
jgi:transposase